VWLARWVCYSCRLWGPKSIYLGNGLPLLVLRRLPSLPVSMPLRIVNCCWSCSCKWRYINVESFNPYGLPHPMISHNTSVPMIGHLELATGTPPGVAYKNLSVMSDFSQMRLSHPGFDYECGAFHTIWLWIGLERYWYWVIGYWAIFTGIGWLGDILLLFWHPIQCQSDSSQHCPHASERLFSSACDLHSDSCNHLSEHRADMLLFIKHNHCHHIEFWDFSWSLLCYTLVSILVFGYWYR